MRVWRQNKGGPEGVFWNRHHQFTSKLGPAAHGGSRAAFGDELVQELWEPHGGVGH